MQRLNIAAAMKVGRASAVCLATVTKNIWHREKSASKNISVAGGDGGSAMAAARGGRWLR